MPSIMPPVIHERNKWRMPSQCFRVVFAPSVTGPGSANRFQPGRPLVCR